MNLTELQRYIRSASGRHVPLSHLSRLASGRSAGAISTALYLALANALADLGTPVSPGSRSTTQPVDETDAPPPDAD